MRKSCKTCAFEECYAVCRVVPRAVPCRNCVPSCHVTCRDCLRLSKWTPIGCIRVENEKILQDMCIQ
jgi:hypothetical protein